jgi:dTMP kinase
MKNVFISFEGPNAAGKSTQIKLLEEYFEKQKQKVIVAREPGGTKIGEELRSLVKYTSGDDAPSPATELLMFSAARAQLLNKVIIPYLTMGCNVIVDRFADSTTVYQGYGHNVPFDLINAAHSIAVRKWWPDITFVFDISPEESYKRCVARGEQDRFEKEGINFFRKIQQGFSIVANANSDRCIIINASQSIEKVHQDIINHLKVKGIVE